MAARSVARRIPPRPTPDEPDTAPRERIIRNAYELFRAHGYTAVGVDRIVAVADVAKTTLYHHFGSKDALIVAVLERHDELWRQQWLEGELRKGETPRERVAALFDALDTWFRSLDYEGCMFMNALVETHDRQSIVRAEAVRCLEATYETIRRAFDEVAGSGELAHRLQLLTRGAIVAALQGEADQVRQVRDAAERLL